MLTVNFPRVTTNFDLGCWNSIFTITICPQNINPLIKGPCARSIAVARTIPHSVVPIGTIKYYLYRGNTCFIWWLYSGSNRGIPILEIVALPLGDRATLLIYNNLNSSNSLPSLTTAIAVASLDRSGSLKQTERLPILVCHSINSCSFLTLK